MFGGHPKFYAKTYLNFVIKWSPYNIFIVKKETMFYFRFSSKNTKSKSKYALL